MHNNDIIHKKALKSVSSVLKEFSQIANIEPKLTTYGTKGVGNLGMSSVSTVNARISAQLQISTPPSN